MIDIKELEENLLEFFSYDEVFIFLTNFTKYIGFDKNNKFVIDIDNVYKWIGYSYKSSAKRTILRVLIPNTQYTIYEQNYISGQNRDIIMLTPNSFKELCMFANTYKAKSIRKFYIAIEDYLYKNIEDRLISAENRLKTIEEGITTYINRSSRDYPQGNTVYIVKECGLVRDVYKIVCTINMRYRERAYHTSSNLHVIVYTKVCNNHKELEKLMHKRFIDYKYMNRPDWFKISFSKLRQSLDELQAIQDNYIGEYYINNDALNYDNIINKKTDTVLLNSDNILINFKTIKNIYNLIPVNILPEIIHNNNNLNNLQTIITKSTFNFSEFISECFDINTNTKTTWVEIAARYRLWARSTENIKNELTEYLKVNGFNKVIIYDNNCKHIGYSGLKIIPLPKFTKTNKHSAIERRFLSACCKPSITGRITIKELREKYFEWRKNIDDTFLARPIADMVDMKTLCNKLFLPINDGYYGCCFKERKDIKKYTTIKQVEQLKAKTIATYSSMH